MIGNEDAETAERREAYKELGVSLCVADGKLLTLILALRPRKPDLFIEKNVGVVNDLNARVE
jgi:hypothetical protein